MADQTDTFRALRIADEGGGPRGGLNSIGLSDLNGGELLVRVGYSNLNYKDALAATGKARIARRLPIVGGIDVAGVVESSEEPGFEPGEEVLVTGFGLSEDRDGGYAEYARLRSDHALKLPRGLDARRAMALGTAGITAALAVTRMEHNDLSPESGPIAVTGASGGVGSLAVDILCALDYEVVAVTGNREARGYLKGLGASEVLLRQEIEMGGRPLESARWAGAVDTAGGKTLGWLTRTARKDGRIAVCGNAGGMELETTVMPFILRGVDLLGIDSDWADLHIRRRLWSRMVPGADLHPPHLDEMTRTIGFDELPEALGSFIGSDATGRSVVRIKDG